MLQTQNEAQGAIEHVPCEGSGSSLLPLPVAQMSLSVRRMFLRLAVEA